MAGHSAQTKIDPRVKRTRRLLSDALVSLILEKEFAAISIKDVTDRAEVAYITFFRHYESLDSLLMQVLAQGQADLMTRIETLAKSSGSQSLETEGRLIFEYIAQNSDLFRVLLKSQSVRRIRTRVLRNISVIFLQSCNPLAKLRNRTVGELAANHIANSLLALIEWWLEKGMFPTPAGMGKVYKSLIIDSTVEASRSLSSALPVPAANRT